MAGDASRRPAFDRPASDIDARDRLLLAALALFFVAFALAGFVDWLVRSEELGFAVIAAGPSVVGLALMAFVLRSDLSPSMYARVLAWSIGGVLVLGTIALAGLLLAGIALLEFFPVLQFLAALGGAAGLAIGYMEARSIERAREAERERELLLFLNKLLRHNVLNRIQAVQGYADMLAREGEEDLVAVIEDSTDDIVSLVEDVRVLVDAATTERPIHPTPLASHLEDAVDSLRTAHPDVDVTLDLPQELHVEANSLLTYLFQPLLTNAVDHNDADAPRIEIDYALDDERVVVELADNGPGLSAERRLEFATIPQAGDYEVGLYMAHALAESYDGRLWAESRDPRGLAVYVELPRSGAPMPGGEG